MRHYKVGNWGLEIGDWKLGIGNWGLGIGSCVENARLVFFTGVLFICKLWTINYY
ncbi:MAG: hypothetical protein HC785_23930 [Calothrix sp. CSU_2_0]|nr:hypothetical protein [Calothrix sp. CSU_2_0]